MTTAPTPANLAALRPHPVATIVDVTPDVAQRWLDANTHNRNIRPRVVDGYARDMAAGQWVMTGEAIKFASDGTLLDGQHRLLAVARAGVTVRMLVVNGLSAHAQDVMDSGAKRQAADALRLSGHSYSTALAATARLAMYLGSGGVTKKTRGGSSGMFTNPEVLGFVADNPDLAASVEEATSYAKKIDAHVSVMAYVWWRCAKVSRAATEEFFHTLAEHETRGKGDPRAALIKRLATSRRNSERLSQTAQASLFLRAWNAWRKGHEMGRLPIESRSGVVQIPNPR